MKKIKKLLDDLWWDVKFSRPYNSIKTFFGKIKLLLTNKKYRNVIKTAIKGWPWDDCFLLELEKAKLEEMVAYYERNQSFVGVEKCIRDMKICVNLLDIMISEGDDLFEYKWDSGVPEYVCKKTDINLRNIDRFVNNESEKKLFIKFPHDFYVRKATHLYYLIRERETVKWWD